MAGDWDGDGDDTPGVFRSGRWYELDSLRSGIADREGSFGSPGDIAVPGDWDRDHDDSPGVFRPSTGTWYLTTDLGKPAGAAFRYGDRTYAPLPVSW